MQLQAIDYVWQSIVFNTCRCVQTFEICYAWTKKGICEPIFWCELQNVSSKNYSRHWTKAKCTTPWAGRRVLHPDAWKWNQHVPAAVLKSVAQQVGLVLQAVAQDVLVVYSCWYVPPITWKSSNSAKRCNVYYHLEDVETIKLSGRTAPCVLIFLHLW